MRATWVQKSLANAAWDPFGTKTRPGRVKDAATPKNYYSKIDLLDRKCRSKGDSGSDLGPQMAPKMRF